MVGSGSLVALSTYRLATIAEYVMTAPTTAFWIDPKRTNPYAAPSNSLWIRPPSAPWGHRLAPSHHGTTHTPRPKAKTAKFRMAYITGSERKNTQTPTAAAFPKSLIGSSPWQTTASSDP